MRDYLPDYDTLGIAPGCTLLALKSARRRLVKSWHPDRFPAESDARQRAERRIKEINTAFDRLIAHYRAHGTLPQDASSDPPVWKTTTSSTAESGASERPAAQRFDEPLRWRSALFLVIVVITLAATVRSIFVGDDDPTDETVSLPSSRSVVTPALPSPSLPAPSRSSNTYFTIGSSLGDVYAIQGIPTATETNIWHYGKSAVYFSEGAVVGWNHDAANPLKAEPFPQTQAPTPTPGPFTIGSSKADVRAIQGAPLVETDTLWDFGLAKVYFRDDRVIGWDSSPMYPLKARK